MKPTLPARHAIASMMLACVASGAGSIAFADTADDEIAAVTRLHRTGQTEAGLERAERVLAARPSDAAMRFLKGVMLADSQRPAQALAVFAQLSQDHPGLAEAHNNIAALHASMGQYDKAREALERALQNQPGYAVAHENLGDVYAVLAGRSYARALGLEPSSASLPPKLALVRELFAAGGAARAPGSSP